jgi:uncharacterized membrane protein
LFIKLSTRKSRKDGALTVLLQLIAGIGVLVFIPFFEMKFPNNPKLWLFLGLSTMFYALSNRLHTTARKNLNVSTDSILKQSETVFLYISGIIFFHEKIAFIGVIGIFLIIISNILILYNKGRFSINKFVYIDIISIFIHSCAVLLDVGNSSNFNLPIYISITLLAPAILTLIFERIKLSDIKNECAYGDKKAILIGGLTWGLLILLLLKAYSLHKVTIITPICALTVLLEVIASYFFLKENTNLVKNIILSIFIIFGIFLVSFL